MNPILAAILENVLPVLFLIFTPLLGVLGSWLLLKLKQKTGLSISAEQEKMLDGAIEKGVGFAEQWALNKSKVPADAPDGAQKLDKALEFISDFTKKQGLQDKAKDELVKLIEARLGLAAVDAPVVEAPAPAPVVVVPAEPVK